MKILVLESSGNKKGSSNLLAEQFIKGAKENGNEVTVYDVLRNDIRPCLGCGHCGMAGPCVQKDDYEKELKQMLLDTDMIVFVMPVYYYNWPAQMKAVVDRFYSMTGELTDMHKKTAILTVAWDNTDYAFDIVKAYYGRIVEYMQFETVGEIYGKGCGTVSMTNATEYPQAAYKLGLSVK